MFARSSTRVSLNGAILRARRHSARVLEPLLGRSGPAGRRCCSEGAPAHEIRVSSPRDSCGAARVHREHQRLQRRSSPRSLSDPATIDGRSPLRQRGRIPHEDRAVQTSPFPPSPKVGKYPRPSLLRTRTTRVLCLSLVLLASSVTLSAAPRDQRNGGRGEPAIVKIAKRLAAGIRSLGDTLTVPIP